METTKASFSFWIAVFWLWSLIHSMFSFVFGRTNSPKVVDAPTDATPSESVRGPLLAFSYAGMLWSYYLGVVGWYAPRYPISNIL